MSSFTILPTFLVSTIALLSTYASTASTISFDARLLTDEPIFCGTFTVFSSRAWNRSKVEFPNRDPMEEEKHATSFGVTNLRIFNIVEVAFTHHENGPKLFWNAVYDFVFWDGYQIVKGAEPMASKQLFNAVRLLLLLFSYTFRLVRVSDQLDQGFEFQTDQLDKDLIEPAHLSDGITEPILVLWSSGAATDL